MKTLLLFFVFGLSLSSFAQNATTAADQKQFIKSLHEELNLDTYQQREIDHFLTEQSVTASEIKAKKEALKLDPENAALKMSLRKQIQVAEINLYKKLNILLDKNQYANWVRINKLSEEKQIKTEGGVLVFNN